MKIGDMDRQAMVDAYLAGESASKVAVRFGVSWATVLNSVRRLGYKVRSLSEAHASNTLDGLIDDYRDGMTYAEIATKYGVSPTTIARSIKRHGVPPRLPRLTPEQKIAKVKIRRSPVDCRRCTKCNAERPKNTNTGKRSRCKTCSAEYMATWRANNPERAAITNRKHQAKRRGNSTRWYRANVEAGREYVARRYARRKGAAGSHTAAEWAAVKESQCGRCFDCSVIKPLTRGHLVPLSRGGSDDISNIVAQCQPCNSKQHARIHPSVLK